jgi:hypothetical protein
MRFLAPFLSLLAQAFQLVARNDNVFLRLAWTLTISRPSTIILRPWAMLLVAGADGAAAYRFLQREDDWDAAEAD